MVWTSFIGPTESEFLGPHFIRLLGPPWKAIRWGIERIEVVKNIRLDGRTKGKIYQDLSPIPA